MTRVRLCLALTLVAGVAGCPPEKRLVWSPDGRYAAVRGADGLYLCDAEGSLSPRLAEDVGQVAWFPDSRRLLVVEETSAGTWAEVAGAIPGERRKALLALAEPLRKELLAYEGDWDKFESSVEDQLTDEEFASLVLYVRDHRSKGLPEKIGDEWDEIKELSVPIHTLRVYEVAEGTAEPGPSILESVNGIHEVRVSPDGRSVAYIASCPEHQAGRLLVASVEHGGPGRFVAEFMSAFPDWSADGRYVVFAQVDTPAEVQSGERLRLGTVNRRQVCDESGALLEEFPPGEELAGTLFHDWLRVRCLRDGRILFTTTAVHLPCTAKDMPQHGSLFALDPDRQATVTRLTPKEVEPKLGGEGLAFFEPNPAGTKIAVPGPSGKVLVFTLASGDAETVQPEKDPEGKTRTLPVWRSSDELCFAVPAGSDAGSPDRAEIVLWSPQGSRCLSKDWPASVVDGFLTSEESESSEGPAPGQGGEE